MYRLAAEQNHPRATGLVAKFCEKGIATSKDKLEALRCNQVAAELGDAPSQCALGCKYEAGNLVEPKINIAVSLYNLCAVQGFAAGQYRLARCYENGSGVVHDIEEAARLLYSDSGKQG